jgi:hypothetical protein
LKFKGKSVLKHVFGNFRNRLKAHHAKHVEDLEVPTTSPKPARVASHVEQSRYLQEAVDAQDLFDGDKDYCYMCRNLCPFFDCRQDAGPPVIEVDADEDTSRKKARLEGTRGCLANSENSMLAREAARFVTRTKFV